MREHVIINQDRTVIVPESEKKIGIQYDHNVNTISFDCPRYPDVITQLLQKINTNETEIDTLKNHTYKVIYENRLKSENETFVVGRDVKVNDVLRIYNPETLDPIRKGAEITNADGTVLGIMIGRGATSEILVESDMQSIEVYANFWLEIIRSPIITNTLRLNSLEQDIHTIELKLPFGLGIDENGNCGYVKPGEHTVTPFGSGGSGTSRTVGTIEQLQMATVTGLTSTIETKVLDYDYIIQTESTGGNDASVSINGTNYLYSDVKSNPEMQYVDG